MTGPGWRSFPRHPQRPHGDQQRQLGGVGHLEGEPVTSIHGLVAGVGQFDDHKSVGFEGQQCSHGCLDPCQLLKKDGGKVVKQEPSPTPPWCGGPWLGPSAPTPWSAGRSLGCRRSASCGLTSAALCLERHPQPSETLCDRWHVDPQASGRAQCHTDTPTTAQVWSHPSCGRCNRTGSLGCCQQWERSGWSRRVSATHLHSRSQRALWQGAQDSMGAMGTGPGCCFLWLQF